MRQLRRFTERFRQERGSASLEFITVGMILLVPLVYLVLSLAAIQAGAYAVESAARQAARVFVQSSDTTSASAAASSAVAFALADHGIGTHAATVSVTCQPRPDACLTRQGFVTVDVDLSIALPGIPAVLTGNFPLAVPLHATATEQVSRFWASQ
jgi:Flp pilus assembly protein TadG